jgi:hypothetical protein
MSAASPHPAVHDPVAARLAAPLDALRSGGLGFVGADLPIDLLLASGRPFGHLPWLPDAATPWADQWLESGFPGWARSILEQWHAGAFDGLEAVVFSRTDDASQRLYYYVRELQQRRLLRGPRPLILDLALVPRDSSLAHSAAAIGLLADALDIDEHALRRGVARADALRLQLHGLQQQRNSGVFFERLARALLWSDPTAWIDGLQVPAGSAARRLLLAGSMPPDQRLHLAVEQAGACIVDETHGHALGRLGMPMESRDSPITLHLARQLRACAVGPRAFFDRAAWIVRRAQAARAAGVILWLTREDEGLAWQVPAMRRALDAADLPTLVLPAASWRGDDGAMERIAAFCQEPRRGGEAA